MGYRIGIIAGSGKFPFLILDEAQQLGYTCVVAGIRGEAEESLGEKVKEFEWIDVGKIEDLILLFKKNGIQEAIFAGKVDPRAIYNRDEFDETSRRLLSQRKEKSPSAIINSVIDFMDREGIRIKDPTPFLSSYFCQEGILTRMKPDNRVEEDIAFGWEIARKMADLDVGQTVIVKDNTTVAIEGIEGTDLTIMRGAQLAGEGTVVVKVSRTFQDTRVDLPAVGFDTIKSLVEAKSSALCIEAQKVPFFQREEAVPLADDNDISIVVKKM